MVSSYVRMIEGPGGSLWVCMIERPEAFRVLHVSSYIKTGKTMWILIYSCVPDRLCVWLLNISNHEGAIRMLDILKIALRLVLILFGKVFVSHWIMKDVGYADWLGLLSDSCGEWLSLDVQWRVVSPPSDRSGNAFSLLSVFCSLLSFRDRKDVIVFPSQHFFKGEKWRPLKWQYT